MSIVFASTVEEIRAALNNSDVTEIRVAPGDYYVDDFDENQGFVIDRDVAIVSSVAGERANFHARADFLKGIFLVKSGSSATFDGIGFYDTRTLFGQYQQGNEAAIRHEGDLRECPELCVSALTHAGFRYGYALKRSSNRIANWFRAANHSLTLRPSFSNFRMAR